MTKAKTPDQMSVSELRSWLSDFGKQRQNHYQQNQAHYRRGRSPEGFRGRLSVRERARGFEHAKQQATSTTKNPTTTKTKVMPGDENQKPSTSAFSSSANRNEPEPITMPNPTPGKASDATFIGNFATVKPADSKQDETLAAGFVSPQILVQNREGTDEFEAMFHAVDVEEQFLALTMTQSSWSSSVEANASETSSVVATAVDFGVTSSIAEDKPMVFEQARKLPQTWSDMESFDFDSSSKSSSGEDEEDSSVQLGTTLNLFDNTNSGHDKQPHQWEDLRKKQAAPMFQGGYWSDHNDASDEDDDERDDLSIATGLMTEPPRCQSNKNLGGWRSRKTVAERRRERNYRRRSQVWDNSDNLSLSDFAMASVADFAPTCFAKIATEEEQNGPATDVETTTMHNANLFQNKTMTSRTLDVICNGGKRADTGSSKYQRPSLSDFFEQGQDEEGTTSSWSVDSGKPSVNPDAVDSKLGKLFNGTTNGKTTSNYVKPKEYGAKMTPETRQDDSSVDPRVTDDTQQREPVAQSLSMPTESFDSISSVGSSFSSAVQKFGGTGGRAKAARRKSRVERQKQALEQKWAAERVPKPVKKTKWQVDKSSGTYKKKVVLDFEK